MKEAFITIAGLSGSVAAVILPFIDKITHLFQFVGAGLGIVLVCLSILHKVLEIKKVKDGDPKNPR